MRAERRSRGRASALAAAILFIAATLTACACHEPLSLKTKDARLPAGWARFSYGSLSVGAPATWRVSSTPWPSCSLPPPHVVGEYTTDTVTTSACGSGPAGEGPTVEAVSIVCWRGKAKRIFSGPGPTVTVNGKTLHQDQTRVYLQGNGWEGAVELADPFGSPRLGAAILSTVEPTGKSC